MNQRLSSDNLYHFTNNPETIVKIITNGLRYSLSDESIPIKSLSKNLFNISFCDIKFNESDSHRKCYGNNAIVLTKEWGIEKGVSPVRYVHSNSPGLSDTYVSLKNNYHLLRGLSMNAVYPSDLEFFKLYLFTSIMEIDNNSDKIDLKKELSNNFESFRNKYNKLDREFVNFYNTLKSRDNDEALIFSKYIDALIYRITELHNELIERDNFTRTYEDNFKCPIENKEVKRVLYDEREWRAIYFEEIEEDVNNEEIEIIKTYIEQGYLPTKYNLTFTENDIIAIVAGNSEAKEIIIENAQSKNCLLSKQFIKKKIFTINEFYEI